MREGGRSIYQTISAEQSTDVSNSSVIKLEYNKLALFNFRGFNTTLADSTNSVPVASPAAIPVRMKRYRTLSQVID